MAGVVAPDVTAIPLGRPSPGASSNQPERQGQRMRPRSRPRARAHRSYSVLLPAGLAVPPTLPPARCALAAPFHPYPWRRALRPSAWAVCFLWRFPWGRPRRTLSGAASVWSPDFPPLRSGGRPADWRKGHRGAWARRSRRIGPVRARVSEQSLVPVHCSFTWIMGLCRPSRRLACARGRPVAFLGGECLWSGQTDGS